jgi:ribosomal protein S18 acetylase RimI-like enzyme
VSGDGRGREIRLRAARDGDAETLARLMTAAISWGRLGELGARFVTLLHRHIVASPHAVCLVAEDDAGISGYLAAVTDTRAFYREFLRRRAVAAAWAILPGLWHPARWRVVLRGLRHFPSAPRDDPRAEAISFAVRPGAAGGGIGRALFRAVVAELARRGATVVKFATVEASNEAANAFYRKLGCELVRTEPFYRDSLVNVYFYRVGDRS